MGKRISCCKSCEANLDQMGIFNQSLMPYQNYSKNVQSLNRYDRFYRVVCYPLHCLKATEFFMELDALQRICDITVGSRSPDSDQVPLHKFYEYYFEGIALWANFALQKECIFKKLVQLNGLFVPRLGAEQNELVYTRKSHTSQTPMPILRRHQSNNAAENSGESPDDQKISVNNKSFRKRSTSIDFHQNMDDSAPFEVAPIVSSPLESFLRMPELNQMFQQRLEPSFIRTDKGIMRRDGITISLQPQIDLFAIKILALLMCRDTPKVKAHLFMDTVIGREGKAHGRDSQFIRHQRVMKACKLLLFYSEIFPKKYECEFKNELIQEIGQGGNPKDQNTNASDLLFDENGKQGAVSSPIVGMSPDYSGSEMDLYWRKDHLLAIEKHFCNEFDSIFEEIFVREFFDVNEDIGTQISTDAGPEKQINRKQMQKKVKTKQWIFDPEQLRQKLIKFFNEKTQKI